MKRIWILLVSVTMILGSTSYALAGDRRTMGPGMMGMGHGMMGPGMMGFGPGMMGMGHGMIGPEMMRFGLGVDLTEDQREQLTDLRVRFIQESADIQAELIRSQAALQTLLIDPSTRDEAIEAKVQKVAAAQARLFVLRVQMKREMQEVLTEEQREQMMRGFFQGQRPTAPHGAPRGPRMPGR